MSRPDSPDVRDPVSGITTIAVKRDCNGCGRRLGDATQDELSAMLGERPLPDVREECGCVPQPAPDAGVRPFGVTAFVPYVGEETSSAATADASKVYGTHDSRGYGLDDEDYGIVLPHSCDEWTITAHPDKSRALAEARRFRAELDAAIAAIEAS